MSGKKEKEKRRVQGEMDAVVEKGPQGDWEANAYEAAGWMYGFLCMCVDQGKDIRKMAVPNIVAIAEHDWREKQKADKVKDVLSKPKLELVT